MNTTSYTGDLKLKTEVGGLFGRRSTIPIQSPPSTSSSGESLLARADSLCKHLRAGKMMNMHANTRQKARKGPKYPYERARKEIHKCLVAISFQGDKPHELLALHEWEKIFDGNIKYYSDQSEDEIRNEIVRLLRLKKSETQ